MPPAASSRSSTYFPKICGNIAARYRSAFSGLALTTLACTEPSASVTTVSVDAHELSACPVPHRGPNDPSPFRLSLTALGPFPASGFDVERQLDLDATGAPLSFNPATVGVDATASDASESDATFIGHSERRNGDRIDVLLWPQASSCSLLSSDPDYPGANAGQALGFSTRSAVALVAGEDATDQRAGSTVEFDTETGTASVVPRESGTLRVSRAYATVTEFGDGLLVAGGTNPFAAAASEDAAGTGEIYRPTTGGFDPTPLQLWSRRTHHAAITLPATGETLLVGGVAPDSATSGPGQLIRQLEAVSPTTLGSSISGLQALELGRVDPVALVLENGLLFVGGGYGTSSNPDDPRGAPVGEVEAFSPDATSRVFHPGLPARPDRTFAALPGGGVLTVASCRDDTASQRADCACFAADGSACDANASAWLDAWWLDPDGNATPVAFAPGGVLTPCPTTEHPLLVAGSDGAPWLLSTRDDGTPACLWRFEAWPEDPGGISGDVTSRPRFVMTTMALDPSPDPRVRPLTFAADALVWVGPNGGLYGARFGQRGPLTRDLPLLLSPPGSNFRPAHLVPDRDPHSSMTADGAPALVFHGEAGVSNTLTLAPAVPAVTVWSADTRYDDLAISIDIEAPSDGSAPALPTLVFGSNTGAAATCNWSGGVDIGDSTAVTITAVRAGTRVTLSGPGLADAPCDVPAGALAVGVRAGSATTTLAAFDVTRLLLE